MKTVLVGQNHHFQFVRINNNETMRSIHSAEPSAKVHAAAGDALLSLAADTSSAVVYTSSATSNVADARGESPREDGPSLAVD